MKGVVISGDDGQPLIGATVVIKGSKSGVLTDIDGKFSIENVSNKSLLQFSYIGMKPQDLTPAPNMNVTLMPDVQTLSEVVEQVCRKWTNVCLQEQPNNCPQMRSN